MNVEDWPLYAIAGGLFANAAVLAASLLLPDNRRRWQARRDMRQLDKAKRRRHIHQWSKWSEPSRMPVYSHKHGPETGALPMRYDLHQVRECHDCGLQEWRTESI